MEDTERNKYYIGSTTDTDRGLYQHNHKHTYTTTRMKTRKLVFLEKFDSLELARKIELRLKNLKRKDYINKIIKDGYIKIR